MASKWCLKRNLLRLPYPLPAVNDLGEEAMEKYRRVLSYFQRDRWRIAAALAMLLGSTLLGLLWAYPLAILIDLQTGKKVDQWLYLLFYDATPKDSAVKQVLFLAVLTLGLRLGSEILRAGQGMLTIWVGLAGLTRVRSDLFRKLEELSLAYHRSQPQGDAIFRVVSDARSFEGVLNIVTGLITNVVALILMTILAMGLNFHLALVALLVVPLVIIVMRLYGRVLGRYSVEAREREASMQTVLQRSLTSISLVQACNRQEDESNHFDATVNSSLQSSYSLHRHEVMYWLCLGTVFATGTTVIFAYGAWLVHQDAMSVGALAIFLDYVARLYDPLNKLSTSGSGLISSMAGVQRVFEVLDREAHIKDRPGAQALPRALRRLSLDHVSFAYDPAEPVLRDITATIEPGEMVGFVGASGVGKTTLLNLFPRFYDPTGGSIRLDGIDLRDMALKSLRSHVALVLQENIVLPATIEENIAYGSPGAPRSAIKSAAQRAGAAEFIGRLPARYQTLVHEGGSNLSGGQRQRIGIARALLSGAPIIVLDEPTSALDPHNEALIIELLTSLKGRRSIVLVSHRLSTVADCDRIFVVSDGTVVECGSHRDLLRRRGVYYNLARQQLKLDPLAPSTQ